MRLTHLKVNKGSKAQVFTSNFRVHVRDLWGLSLFLRKSRLLALKIESMKKKRRLKTKSLRGKPWLQNWTLSFWLSAELLRRNQNRKQNFATNLGFQWFFRRILAALSQNPKYSCRRTLLETYPCWVWCLLERDKSSQQFWRATE